MTPHSARRTSHFSEGGSAGASDLLRRVRGIELRTRRLVDSRFAGEYHSVFKGQGIEFAEVREYLPGDDVRNLDWNVTARLGTPYVKKFVEERELTVQIVVDVSASLRWGTRGRFKSDILLDTVAALAMSAVRNNDRVGLLAFSDRIEHALPPRKGRRHVLRLLRDLILLEAAGRGTRLIPALERAARLARSRAVVIVISDFFTAEEPERLSRALRSLAARHDTIAVRLADPADGRLPPAGLLQLCDPETGDQVLVNTASSGVRGAFADSADNRTTALRREFRRAGIDEIELRTDEPLAPALLGFFRRRERRLRR